MSVAVALVFTLIAAATQRMSGIGFALILAPVFALVLDPWTGMTLVIVGGAVVAAIVFAQTRRDVSWRRAIPLAVFGAIGAVLGYGIARLADDSLTRILVGATVIVALTGAIWLSRRRPVVQASTTKGWVATSSLGLVSGIMTALGGLGGPAITVLAAVQRWPHHAFIATAQFVGIGMGALAAALRFAEAGAHGAEFEWMFALAFLACVLAGLLVGTFLYRLIRPAVAWAVTIAVSYLGAAAAIAVGLVGLAA